MRLYISLYIGKKYNRKGEIQQAECYLNDNCKGVQRNEIVCRGREE